MTEKVVNQRVTNALLAQTLETLETNMEKGFGRIEKGQEEDKDERRKLADAVSTMTVNYAECSAIQGQRWEAHEKVHDSHEKGHAGPKRDQTIIDVILAAAVIIAGILGITIKTP